MVEPWEVAVAAFIGGLMLFIFGIEFADWLDARPRMEDLRKYRE